MIRDSEAAVLRLMRQQCGVVRRSQLHALGLPPRTLSRRIAAGLWEPRGKHVLVWAGTARGLLTDSLVAGHALHEHGVLTGYAALAVDGEATEDPWSAVAPPVEPWIRSPVFGRVEGRVLRGPAIGSRERLGVRVAYRDQIVVDLARHLPPEEARRLMFRLAQRQGSATVALLLDGAASREGRRRGDGQLRDLVSELSTGAHSDAEGRLVALLREAGLRDFIVNYPLRVGGRAVRVDVAFPAHRLAIEVDGRAWHSAGERFQWDRTRQNLLVASGWRVLRFTWEDLTRRPEVVIERIVALLAA